jgi:hypothetical protein
VHIWRKFGGCNLRHSSPQDTNFTHQGSADFVFGFRCLMETGWVWFSKLAGMTHQPGFSQAGFATQKKTTRREQFLTCMEGLIPWAKLLTVIEPLYPRPCCRKERTLAFGGIARRKLEGGRPEELPGRTDG